MLASLVGLALFAPKATVVMIHGAGGGGWEYDLWRPVFEKAGYRVVARDLMPVGSLAQTRFEDYLRQVQFWRPISGKVILVGASMGGILALKAAEQEPPTAMVLVNSVAPKGLASAHKSPLAPAVVKWANGPLKDTEDSMPDSDRKTILWAWKKWRDESGAVLNEIRVGVPVRKPSNPMLVVIGERDTDILPARSWALAKWADADVHTYPGMSHVGPLMGIKAKKVAEAVVRWLDGQLKAPSHLESGPGRVTSDILTTMVQPIWALPSKNYSKK
jgi:pimeloyl-ACP methyl ester carboxylesterase